MENCLENIIKNVKPSNSNECLKVKNFEIYKGNPYGATPGMVLADLEKFCKENKVVQVTFLNVSETETRIVVVYKASEC